MIPVSTRPTGPAPGRMRCSSSRRGSLRGLSVGLAGGMMESRASSRVVPLALPSLRSTFHPLYQDMLVLVCNMLSPCQPEMGTNGTATGLYPTFLMKPETSFWISSNLAWLYGGSVESILLTATMSCLTPRVQARRACSLVCPFLEIPASNSPVPEAMMSTPQSAWLVPVIMFLMKSRWPGASLPIALFLRNRLKYALTMKEVETICKQRLIKIDGKLRTD